MFSARSGKSVFGGNLLPNQGAHVFNRSSTAVKSNGGRSGGSSLNAKLVRIAEKLTAYIKLYLDGDLDTLRNELTLDVYTDYSKILYLLKRNRNSDSEIMRRSVAGTLSTLYAATSIYEDCLLMKENNEALADRAGILDDMDRLRDFLTDLQSSLNTSIFGDHMFTVPAVQVNAEYVEYIRVYGYPNNGVFDPDLLGQILKQMN